MERKFVIKSRNSVGNLHISLSGEFNRMCAWELIKIIKLNKTGGGRVFINTKELRRISPEGVDLFKVYMCGRKIKPDWLYFKGDKGFEIAPDGSRVLVCGKGDEWNKEKKEKGTFGFLRCVCRNYSA